MWHKTEVAMDTRDQRGVVAKRDGSDAEILCAYSDLLQAKLFKKAHRSCVIGQHLDGKIEFNGFLQMAEAMRRSDLARRSTDNRQPSLDLFCSGHNCNSAIRRIQAYQMADYLWVPAL